MIDIDLIPIPPARARLAMRLGWNARKANLVERLQTHIVFARSVAIGRHPSVRLFSASMLWAHEGRGTYDEFKAWRKRVLAYACAEEQRLSARLRQVRSMANPYKDAK